MDVLVADDNEEVLSLLANTLTARGYTVTTVRDGIAALRAVERNPGIRLAILNWMMPGLDGLVVSKKLKANPAADIRTVVVVGRRFREEIGEAFSSWADYYISKPLRLASVIDCVDVAGRAGRRRRAVEPIACCRAGAPLRGRSTRRPGCNGDSLVYLPSSHVAWN
ncbi:MAG: response regulator [Planctomycetes bacterium]|nr:response regulator [Planctomycetota bacterium]